MNFPVRVQDADSTTVRGWAISTAQHGSAIVLWADGTITETLWSDLVWIPTPRHPDCMDHDDVMARRD